MISTMSKKQYCTVHAVHALPKSDAYIAQPWASSCTTGWAGCDLPCWTAVFMKKGFNINLLFKCIHEKDYHNVNINMFVFTFEEMNK